MPQPIVVTPPAGEPVSLADAKLHLRVDTSADDALIEAQISAAREWAEQFTGRSLAPQTLELAFDAFPDPGSAIELPGAPVRSVVSIVYDDEAGDEQPFTGYAFDQYGGRLLAAHLSEWPTGARYYANAVRVRYEAGYSLPTDDPQTHPLPKSVVNAVKLYINWLHDRDEVAREAAESLLRPYRITWGV